MITKYDNFLTESVDDKLYTMSWFEKLKLPKKIVTKDFFIDDILHITLDVDSHKVIKFYMNNFESSLFSDFVANVYLNDYKKDVMSKLKKLNIGIQDIYFERDQYNNINYSDSYDQKIEYNLIISLKKTFFTNLISMFEQDYANNDEEAIQYCGGYTNGKRDTYDSIIEFIKKYITNINRLKETKIKPPMVGYSYRILKRFLINNIGNIPKPDYNKVDIQFLLDNGFKPIDFVSKDTRYYSARDIEILEQEKTKPYNL